MLTMDFNESKYAWIINKKYLDDYKKIRLDRPSKKQIRKYYFGFMKKKRSPMFEDELKDVEKGYRAVIDEAEKQISDCMPALLHYMEMFMNAHKALNTYQEKLECLHAKLGTQKHVEDEEGDDHE